MNFSIDRLLKFSWKTGVVVTAFFLSSFIIEPTSLGNFLLYLTISCLIFCQVLYWGARFALYIIDINQKK